MRTIIITTILALTLLVSISPAQNTTNFPAIGHVDRFDPSLDSLVSKDAKIEVLCGGFEWAEGPVWVPEEGNKFGGFVLFSDIPRNSIFKWKEGEGLSLFMKPAGMSLFTSGTARGVKVQVTKAEDSSAEFTVVGGP